MRDKLKNTPGRLANGLFYEDSEIAAMYRDALDKRHQLHVLCQLNLCDEDDIKAALKRQGYNGKNLPRKSYVPDDELPNDVVPDGEAQPRQKRKYTRRAKPVEDITAAETEQASKDVISDDAIDIASTCDHIMNSMTKADQPKEEPKPQMAMFGSIHKDGTVTTPTEENAHVKMSTYIKDSALAYAGILRTKKDQLKADIAQLEKDLEAKRTELATVESELVINRMVLAHT